MHFSSARLENDSLYVLEIRSWVVTGRSKIVNNVT